jgi:hypothetical protein
MAIDGYVELSHYLFFYLHFSCNYTLRYFNILFLLDVNMINSCLSTIVKGGIFLNSVSFAFYIFVILPDNSRNFRPIHVACMKNTGMLEHLCCCIVLITIQDIDLINTVV